MTGPLDATDSISSYTAYTHILKKPNEHLWCRLRPIDLCIDFVKLSDESGAAVEGQPGTSRASPVGKPPGYSGVNGQQPPGA